MVGGRFHICAKATTNSKTVRNARRMSQESAAGIGVAMPGGSSSHDDIRATGMHMQLVLRDRLIQNYGKLRLTLARRLGCADKASEALHEAWLRLDGSLQIAQVNNPDAYIVRMAYHLAIGAWRIEASRSSAMVVSLDAVDIGSIPDLAPGPEAIVVDRALLSQLNQIIDLMPRQRRAIFLATRLEQLSIKEVAQRYGIGLGKVRTELRIAHLFCETALRNDNLHFLGRQHLTVKSGGAIFPPRASGRHSVQRVAATDVCESDGASVSRN